jgi:hypothetical protein
VAKANVTSNNWLKLLLNATAIANIADNAATSAITTISIALHTADPGAAGTQATSEATYGGYTRITVARTTGGWTASSAQSSSPVANMTFPTSTSATANTITHFSIGKTSSGATDIFYSGTVTPNIPITATGQTPILTTATAITES